MLSRGIYIGRLEIYVTHSLLGKSRSHARDILTMTIYTLRRRFKLLRQADDSS
jgi:hypothetical protein